MENQIDPNKQYLPYEEKGRQPTPLTKFIVQEAMVKTAIKRTIPKIILLAENLARNPKLVAQYKSLRNEK